MKWQAFMAGTTSYTSHTVLEECFLQDKIFRGELHTLNDRIVWNIYRQ
jgi:hypothetical protein